MRLRNIASALIAALCVNASAQTTAKKGNDPIGDRPKMVVNIVVDGLRADYIEQLWDDLSDGGFRKVIINGAYARSVGFPYLNVGRAADYATIFTGTLPTTHGI
ncbi:MAG: alkaline phosphatase family protein, partial [Paludibacteraceae bacterium]|nr:alkaline phosphatase family protein [Paludibacteraceae bacterium]